MWFSALTTSLRNLLEAGLTFVPLLFLIPAFLVSEVEASRMILVNKPQKKAQESGSPVFQELKAICLLLGMSKPPASITMFHFFSGIEKKVSSSAGTWVGSLLQGDSAEFFSALWFSVEGGSQQSPTQPRWRTSDEEDTGTSPLGDSTGTCQNDG